uniref:F-box domain-containing protein n=1 Tax=Rhabditophanes sp. KR3021 TaxID=114890 RepID=A0AC35TIW6_9BILA
MVAKILANVPHSYRTNLDLVNKRFRAITCNFEDKMDHKCFKSMEITVDYVVHEIRVTLKDVDKNVEKNIIFKHIGYFFKMIDKITFLERGSMITINFTHESLITDKLRMKLQKLNRVGKIVFNYNGSNYRNLKIWENKWVNTVNEFSISTSKAFNSVANYENQKDYKNHSFNIFTFKTSADARNFRLIHWEKFFQTNSFSRLCFEANQKITGKKLYQFIIFIIKQMDAGKLEWFSLAFDAENYDADAFDDFNQLFRDMGYTTRATARNEEVDITTKYFLTHPTGINAETDRFRIKFKKIIK